ncbi:hypothetical protein, partial [Streptomyces oceani]
EMALSAGQEVGCPIVGELVLESPLILDEAALQIQVTIGAVDDDGHREVAIYSQPETTRDDDSEATCHGRG